MTSGIVFNFLTNWVCRMVSQWPNQLFERNYFSFKDGRGLGDYPCYGGCRQDSKTRGVRVWWLQTRFFLWMCFNLYSFLKQRNWKLVFHMIIKFDVHKRLNEWLQTFGNVVVGMPPPMMQLFLFILPSPCALFWTFLPAWIDFPLVYCLEFS